MITDKAFAQQVRDLSDTAFAAAYLILENRADCEDAMSEAILKAYQRRGTLLRQESFRAWFFQILRNEAYTILRRRQRVTPVEELPEMPGEDNPAQAMDLRRALSYLSEQQRMALLLQQEGYELKEIAVALDIPEGTVKSRISRAKSTLRTLLKEDKQ